MLPLVGRELPIIADDYVEARLRHRRAEDHARPRPQRLRDRPPPRPRGDHGDRRGRPHDREAGGRYAGLTVARGARARSSRRSRRGPDPRARSPTAHTVPYSHRSGERIEPLISLQWFMRMDELAAPGDRRRARRPRADPPREPAARRYLDWLENIRPVVHLAPAVVGPPAPRLVPRRRRPTSGIEAAARARAGSATPTCSTRGSARRCGRSRRSAGPRTRPSCAPSTRPTCSRRRATSSSCGSRGW